MVPIIQEKHRPGTQNALSLSLSFSHLHSPYLFLCVCVRVGVCMLACVYEGGLSPTAAVTQLCLVYISSDNSGSKHRSPYADVPLMASSMYVGQRVSMCEDGLSYLYEFVFFCLYSSST